MSQPELRKYEFKTVEGHTMTLHLPFLDSYDYKIEKGDHIVLKYPNSPEFAVKQMPSINGKPGKIIGEWKVTIDKEEDAYGQPACLIAFNSKKTELTVKLRERFRHLLTFEFLETGSDRHYVYYKLVVRPTALGLEGKRYKEELPTLSLLKLDTLLSCVEEPKVKDMPNRQWVFGPDSQPWNCEFNLIEYVEFTKLEGYQLTRR